MDETGASQPQMVIPKHLKRAPVVTFMIDEFANAKTWT